MTARLPCCVPFCRRTTRNNEQFREWLCAAHWRLVSRAAKVMKRRAEAAYAAARAEYEAVSREGDEFARTHGGGIAVSQGIIDRLRVAGDLMIRKARQSNRSWERCKRQAIEAAGGIA